MRQLRPLWQVIIAIMALGLIPCPVESAKNSTRRKKCLKNCSKMKNGLNCIELRVDKLDKLQVDMSGIRNFMERSIVPFEYRNINISGYPTTIVEVHCSDKCTAHELNAVPIKRNILYLRREGHTLVLDEMVVTVGCTCVYPEVREQLSK